MRMVQGELVCVGDSAVECVDRKLKAIQVATQAQSHRPVSQAGCVLTHKHKSEFGK